MKKILSIIFAAAWIGVSAQAEDLSQEKKAAIDELLVESGATKMADGMGQAFFHMRRQRAQNLDANAVEVMQDEVMSAMRDELLTNGALNNLAYPVYHKYLTLTEVQELAAFYKSPLGKKFLSVMPLVSQEVTKGVQSMASSLTPKIETRLKARFEKEGLELGE